MHNKDMALGVVSIGFGGWALYIATKLKSGPDFWPKVVSIGIIILGIVILLNAVNEYLKDKKSGKSTKEKDKKANITYLNVVIIAVILIAYYLVFQFVGYTIPTFLLICTTSFVLGYRNWKVMIPVSLIVTVCLYLAFTQLFGIKFPGVFF